MKEAKREKEAGDPEGFWGALGREDKRCCTLDRELGSRVSADPDGSVSGHLILSCLDVAWGGH